MSYEISSLRYLSVYVEPAGSYAIDGSGTPANFIAVPFQEGFAGPDPAREMLDPMIAQSRIDSRVEKVPGRRSAALSFSTLLASHGVAQTGAAALPTSTTWALRRLLLAIMGGVSETTVPGTATTVVSATTTAITVTSAHGVRWIGGRVIGCIVNGALEAREVLSVAGDVVTVKQAFSAAPAASSAVYGGVTFHPTQDPDTSLQFIAQGVELDDHYVLRGMQGGIQIEAKPGQLAKLSFDLKGAATTSLAAHTGISVPTFANFAPVVAVGSELTMPTVGVSTRNVVNASDFTVKLSFAYEPVTGYNGVENVIRMRRQRAQGGALASGTITLPYEDKTYETARDAKAALALFFQIGNAAGSSWLLSFPTVQITDIKRAASASNLSGLTVSWEAREDSSAVASTTDFSRSAFRLSAI